MPIFLREYGPSVAFGIPGLLMAVATVIFWAGRNKYVHVRPATWNTHSFLHVVRTALFAQAGGRMGLVVAGLGSVRALDRTGRGWGESGLVRVIYGGRRV